MALALIICFYLLQEGMQQRGMQQSSNLRKISLHRGTRTWTWLALLTFCCDSARWPPWDLGLLTALRYLGIPFQVVVCVCVTAWGINQHEPQNATATKRKGRTQVAGRERRRRRRQHQIPKATFRFVNSTPNSISSVCACVCACLSVCILRMPLWHLIDNFVTPRTCLKMHFDNFGVQDLWQVLPLHCYCFCALG